MQADIGVDAVERGLLKTKQLESISDVHLDTADSD